MTIPAPSVPMIRLTRIEQIPDGVFGRLDVPGIPSPLHTCEDDWRQNQRGVSCIPAGSYALHRSIYVKHGIEVFEVVGVPGRQRILIHPGNTEEDTEGCILVGLRRGKVMIAKDEDTGAIAITKEAVVDSRAAFATFMAALASVDEAMLAVTWITGLPLAA